jgi:hypothetical protein
VVNYNFFPSLVTCKALVGLWISPGLPLRKTGLMGEKTTSSPALQGAKKKFRLKRRKRRPGKTSVCHPKKQKGKNVTLLDGKEERMRGVNWWENTLSGKNKEWNLAKASK